MTQRGVVDGVEGILGATGAQGTLEVFLSAGGGAVGIDRKTPAVIGKVLYHLGVVDVHGLAVLYVVTS